MPGDLMTRFRKLRHAIRRMTHQPLAVVERMISNSPCEEVGRPTLRTAPVEIMTTQEIRLAGKLADRAEGAWRGRRLTGTPDRPKEAERTAPNDEHATEHLRGRHLLLIDDPED